MKIFIDIVSVVHLFLSNITDRDVPDIRIRGVKIFVSVTFLANLKWIVYIYFLYDIYKVAMKKLKFFN